MLATVNVRTQAICFTIEGKAVPSGIRPVPIPGGRGSRLVEGRDKSQERAIKAWREQIQLAARQEYHGAPLIGPVAVEFAFYRKRPDNQVGTGRNAGVIKEHAPRYPIQSPDLDKTTRIVQDALKGIIYADDAQIVEARLIKLFAKPGTPPHVEVTIWVLDAETAPLVSERIVDTIGAAA